MHSGKFSPQGCGDVETLPGTEVHLGAQDWHEEPKGTCCILSSLNSTGEADTGGKRGESQAWSTPSMALLTP